VTIRYCPYNATTEMANIVVDGSPNASTVLTLTHWPGLAQPVGLQADLSAQMAYRYVRGDPTVDADVVTNNHFDQDGLVAMLALVDPDDALRHEELLVDVAAAGDFATYRHPQSALASMAIATYADPVRSPIASQLTGPYDSQCTVLYETLLEEVVAMVTEPDRFRELWADEADQLDASENALRRGAITIDERPELDLAIVTIDVSEPERSGHRFAANEYRGAHPMAINNATGCFRILQTYGRRYTFTDRYESWVQYRSSRPLPRVDLRPLADELSSADSGIAWTASSPSSLTPQLDSNGESSLDPTAVLDHLARHLRTAPPAWNPYGLDDAVL
jgi:hypothetical protein